MAHDDTPLEELLRRRGAAAGRDENSCSSGRAGMAVPTGLCGDPELLAAYAEGTLPPAARERLEGHLAVCTACQRAVVRLVRLAPQESAARPSAEQAPALSRTPVFRWRWAVPALAGVALVGSFIYHERSSIFRTARQPLEQSVKTAPATSLPAPETKQETAPKAESLPQRSAEPDASKASERPAEPRKAPPVVAFSRAEASKQSDAQKPIGPGEGGGIGGGILRLPPSRSGDIQAATQARPIRAREKDKGLQQAPAGAPAGEVAQQRSSSTANAMAPPVPPPVPQQFAQQSAPDKPQAAAGAGVGSGRGGGIVAAGVAQKEASAAQDEARAKAMVSPLRSQAEQQDKPAEAEMGARPAAPRSGVRAEAAAGGYAGRAPAAGPKTTAESVVVTPGPTSTVNLDVRRADASRFSKQLQSDKRRFALADGGQLLTSQTASSQWETVAIPSRSPVIDFSIVGRHLWVLLPGGRVGHSPDLGRTWDAPSESGAADAISIAFKNPQSGEIRTRSGRRLQSVDGGETWKPIK